MALADEKYIAFTTFRRDGTPVTTATWICRLDDGRYGFWTSSGSGKAKRLAHTSRVVLQPGNARGKVKDGSQPIEATAALVTGPELDEIRTKIVAKYGKVIPKITKFLGTLGGIVKRNRIPYADRGVVVTL